MAKISTKKSDKLPGSGDRPNPKTPSTFRGEGSKPKGSVAKTFDTSKLMPKMTPQDKASLAILQKKYGKDVYKAYTKKP